MKKLILVPIFLITACGSKQNNPSNEASANPAAPIEDPQFKLALLNPQQPATLRLNRNLVIKFLPFSVSQRHRNGFDANAARIQIYDGNFFQGSYDLLRNQPAPRRQLERLRRTARCQGTWTPRRPANTPHSANIYWHAPADHIFPLTLDWTSKAAVERGQSHSLRFFHSITSTGNDQLEFSCRNVSGVDLTLGHLRVLFGSNVVVLP